MLDRTFIVPQPDLPSEHALENLLPNLKAATVQTLDTILSLQGATESGLGAFVDAISELREIKPIEEELIYECFLRLGGFEAFWCGVLREHGFLEKHIFLGRNVGKGGPGVLADTLCMQGCAVVRMAAERANDESSAAARIKILAYTIMAAYGGRYLEYEGPVEVYYLINYVLKTASQARIHDDVLRWSRNAETASNRLFYVESSTFFMNELRYARDRDLIEKVVIARRSHYLLYLKIRLFCRGQHEDKEKLTDAPAIDSEARAKLKGMLVCGFERAMARYSELILEYLQSEELTKHFIKETRCPAIFFYKICHTIDCGYAEALVHNLVYFGHIASIDLAALAASPFLRFVAKGMKAFKIIAGELIKRGMPFDADNFFMKRPPKAPENVQDQAMDAARSLSQASLRDDHCTDLRKIEYLVDNNAVVCSQRFVASLDSHDKPTALKVFFKLARPKLIPAMYRFAGPELVEELQRMAAYSLFYVRCLNYLVKAGVDISSMQIKDDLTAYGVALKRRIRGCKFGGDAVAAAQPTAAGSTQAGPSSAGGSGLALPDGGNRAPAPDAPKSQNRCGARLHEPLEDALFFRNSSLVLKNGNSRFTLSGCFTAEYSPRENVFLKLDAHTRLYMRRSAAYVQQNGSAPEKILSLRSRSRDEGKAANEESCVGSMDSAAAGEYLCFGLKCVYNRKMLSIIINGQEHRCPMRSLEWISLDQEFNGTVTNLIYYQSNVEFHSRECRDDLEYYRMVVAPLQKLLKYRQRAGMLLNGPKPFILNGAMEVKVKNVLDYKTPREVEDAI